MLQDFIEGCPQKCRVHVRVHRPCVLRYPVLQRSKASGGPNNPPKGVIQETVQVCWEGPTEDADGEQTSK